MTHDEKDYLRALENVAFAALGLDDVHAPGCSHAYRPDLRCKCGRAELTEAIAVLQKIRTTALSGPHEPSD